MNQKELKKTKRKAFRNQEISLILIFVLAISCHAFDSPDSLFDKYWSRHLIASDPQSAHYFTGSRIESNDPQNTLIQAYSYQSADWDDRALEAYREVTSGVNADWSAFWMGELLQENNQTSRLREFFSLRSPPWGKYWLAVWHFHAGEYDSAITLFEPLASLSEGHTIMRLMAGYFQGVALSRVGQSDSSRVVFDYLISKYGRSLLEGEINYRIAANSFSLGEWNSCRDYLASAIDFYESSSRKSAHWWIDEAYFLLGAIDFMEGRHILAIRQFEKLKNKFPESSYIDRLPYLSILGEIETRASGAEIDSIILEALSPDLMADVFLRIGYIFMQDGDLLTAQNNFFKGAEVAKETLLLGECYLFAGECSYGRREYREAVNYYQLASDCCEDRKREASWGMAWCYFRLREYQDARLYWATVFSGFQDDLAERARLAYAETYLYQNQYFRAAQELQDFLKTCNGVVCDRAQYDLIIAYEALDDTNKTIENSEKFISQYRRSNYSEEIVPKLANLYFDRENYREIIELTESIEDFSVSRETADRVRLLAERSRYHLGIYDDPLMITDEFLRKYPNSPLVGEALIEIGTYLCNIGDYEKGAMTFDHLRKRDIPDTLWIDASYRLGTCYLGMGDTVAASEIFNQLFREFPQSPVTARGIVALGDYFYEIDKTERAMDFYNKVLENSVENEQLYIAEFRLAVAYEKLEKYYEASIMYKNLATGEGTPWKTRQEALLGVARVYYNMAEYESGLDFAESISETLATGDFRCRIKELKGKFALRLGDVDLAMENLLPNGEDSLYCPGTDDASILFDLSLALEYRDLIESARKVWENMISTSDNDSVVALAREKLNKYEDRKLLNNQEEK